jgi:superfamily II DNA or RNA helicase
MMPGLSSSQRLTLQQLRLLDWAGSRGGADDLAGGESGGASGTKAHPADGQWNLTSGLTLAPWQREAAEAWFAAGRHGTIKVVTGAGKTVVALAIAERLQSSDPELRIAIVVPTIVLMQQWHQILRQRSNLSPEAIGRLGGGHADDFKAPRRVLIAVLSSARKVLPDLVRRAGIAGHLLFVADECHRVGAPEMSAVLNTPRSYSLGLSATPERDDDASGMPAVSPPGALDQELGGIVYEMTFAQAIQAGVLPPFAIHHYGLPLNADEARRYHALTRAINDARRELMASSPSARKAGGGDQLMTWARHVSARAGSGLSGLATKYVNDVTQRKRLLYRAESRAAATRALVQEALATRKDARVILFHESIDEVISLFELLTSDGLPTVMEHSELPGELRQVSLELFRNGTAQVIVSARSLIEGFDVPEADLGIIVASSSSPRQRIQSIGRVLRKPRDGTGGPKTSRICVLYVRDSVDEAIYEKQDWDKLIGANRSRYFTWDPPAEPREQPGPPRAAIPGEMDIDLNLLRPGDAYPGRYEGAEFSADTLRNVTDADGHIASNPQGIPKLILDLKGQPGRFKVTAARRAILILLPDGHDGWRTIYGGTLDTPFQFKHATDTACPPDITGLTLGDHYPGPVEPATRLRFRQRAGGVIAKRVPGGEVFAHGPEAECLIAALRDLARAHRPISRILVNPFGHVLWIEDGIPRFIGAVEGELQFPDDNP